MSASMHVCKARQCPSAMNSLSAKYSMSMPISGSDLVVWKHQFYRQIGSSLIAIGSVLMDMKPEASNAAA
ncbi:hypothetical protein [Xylella fastidiosa]|uniref:hypothetical protein n=1 Tax=Xylella fastidiosa TaxID=2371 RepID=UPI00241DC00F|nr:hypothetical protein [Xylella fastidiosa]